MSICNLVSAIDKANGYYYDSEVLRNFFINIIFLYLIKEFNKNRKTKRNLVI